MDSNPQDPIKIVFTHLNQVVLGLLTASSSPDRQKIRAALDSEILILSEAVNQICETTIDNPSSAQSRAESGPGQVFRAPVIPHDGVAFESTGNVSWAQCDAVPSFAEQQQCQTPVSLQWSPRRAHHQISHTSSTADQFAYQETTPQSFTTTAEDQDFPLNISSSYLLSLGLSRESEDSAATTIAQTDASSACFGTNLASLLDQTGSHPTCNVQQGYEEDPNEFPELFDFDPGHELLADMERAPATFVNTFTHRGSDQQASGALQGNITAESFYQIDTQAGLDSNEVRSIAATPTTERQIEKLNELHYGRHDCNPQSSSTQRPDHLEIQKRLRQTISTDKDHVIELLTRLTYAIGSAESLIQLKTSVSFARQKKYVSDPSQYAPHDLAHTMRALDMLDTVSHHSSILRRYYLVRLLRHRLKCEADFHKEREGSRHHEKKLKNNHRRVETNSNIHKDKDSSNKRQLTHEKSTRSIRADSQALQDMMKALYPHLRPTPKTAEHDRARQYERLLAKLKNRLACARNWHQFAEEYSVGILAVIPSGSRSGISSDQIEKLPAGVIATFLEFLRKVKGPFLKAIGMELSEHIFEILCGNKNVPVYGLEECDDAAMLKGNGDPKLLLVLCSVEETDSD